MHFRDRAGGFHDFGIVGRFDTRQRMMVLRYILSFSTEDFGELARLCGNGRH